jgi:hypothetical protein
MSTKIVVSSFILAGASSALASDPQERLADVLARIADTTPLSFAV